MIGNTLGHYEILEKLGEGGMGEVYRARDTKLDREIAIKVLPTELATDPERAGRFEREAKAIAALNHPNIVTIHSVEEADGHHFLTMEVVNGKTLAEMIPVGGYPLYKLFDLAVPMADALASAHARGVTHRDLKPTNIMIDDEGRLKILDFGLAKLLESDEAPDGATMAISNSVTQAGGILGTPAYMAPEQADGKNIDHRADIFSLGVVLFEMCTGDRPFKGDSSISTISSVLKDQPASVTELKPSLPRHLARIIQRCLEKDPEKRFQTSKDVRNELDGLRSEVLSGEHDGPRPGAQVPRTRLGGWRWVLAGTAVIAVAAIGFWQLSGNGSGSDSSDVASVASSTSSTVAAGKTAPPTSEDRMMAVVLPFDNLGSSEDAYFAAGMSDEIAGRLATVGQLGVISRTTASQYDRSGKTIKQIGADLGVDYVLEGSVRWARGSDGNDRVRISPQLVRVSDDTALWSQTYDRDVDDIFEIQSEIASSVVAQLGVTLVASEQAAIEDRPTDNLQAYQAYLKAMASYDAFGAGNFSDWERAQIDNLSRAVELDPNFIEAWARLTVIHSSVYYLGLERTDARLGQAKQALEAAEGADSEHPRTRWARGYYYYFGFRDYDRALEEFEAAQQALPNDAEARESIGYIHRRKGNWDQADEHLQAALKLNPQSSNILRNLGDLAAARRDFESAIAYADRAIEIEPLGSGHYSNKADYVFAATGDSKRRREIMEDAPPGSFNSISWVEIYSADREWDRAMEALDAVTEEAPYFKALRPFLVAMITCNRDGVDQAQGELREAEAILKSTLQRAPSNHNLREMLSVVYAYLGDESSAMGEARMAIDLSSKDMFSGPEAYEWLASVYTITDQDNEAVDVLERLLTTTYEDPITIHQLRAEPRWDTLRDNQRFQTLIASP